MSTFRPLIVTAVGLLGSQQKLAQAAGCSQQQISYLLNQADRIAGTAHQPQRAERFFFNVRTGLKAIDAGYPGRLEVARQICTVG